MIEGLQIQSETQNGKVFYYPAVLTVEYISQYPNGGVSFFEISDYWSLPANWSQSKDKRVEGTNLSDKVLHSGDVATFSLNLNPNKNTGGVYHNIGAIAPAGGKSPIEAQAQQPAPQSGGSWASEPAATGEPYVDKWDLKDINIRKSQGLNVLGAVLRIPNQERMLKVLQAMGFKDFDEANEAHGYGYSLLRRGKPVELPVAVSDMEEEVEEEVTDFADDDLKEDVETVSWD